MRWREVVAAVAVVWMAAGCAQIPRSGAVVEGSRVDAPADSRGLEPVAEGPSPGASPEQVVTGMVAAMVSPADRQAVARSFLTHRFGPDWEPQRQTVVFGGRPRVALKGAGGGSHTGKVTVRVVGTVGSDGRYRRVVPQDRDYPVTVMRQGGTWRVGRFPNLTLIRTGDFAFAYRPHAVYFMAQDGGGLVPVTRYLPNGAGLATRLAAAVLAGPDVEDRAGYGGSLPAGVALAPPATVTTDGTDAVVALTAAARDTTPDQRADLVSQLLATLRGVLPVDDVRLTVDGAMLDLPQSEPVDESPAATVVPVLLRGNRIQRFDGENAIPVPGLSDLSGVAPDEVAQASGGSRFAVTGQGACALYLVAGGQAPQRVLTDAGLSTPSFDRSGWVFTAPSPSRGYVAAVSPDGRYRRVLAPWLAGRVVRSLRISPDGGFAAVVSAVSTRGAGRLDVVPIRRDAGTPQALQWSTSDTRSLPADDVRTAAWRSSTELSVATAAGPGTLPVDGPPVTTGELHNVAQLAPGLGSGIGDLALTADHQLYQYSERNWYRVGALTGVHSIAAPG